MQEASSFRQFIKKSLLTAAALALVVSITAPLTSGAATVTGFTAKSNETSTNNVLGGTETRVTYQMFIDEGEEISEITLQFPEGTYFSNESTVSVSVLDGTDRISNSIVATIDGDAETVHLDIDEIYPAGYKFYVQIFKVSLPNVEGEVSVTGTYVSAGTTYDLPESPTVSLSKISLVQRISNWLDDQPAVQAWNSVTILKLFLKPQLIISCIPNVFHGWLLSLMLVLVGFPLAIPLGLAFAFIKVYRTPVLNLIAALYTSVIRGTPLFLQIYLAFFGLPLMGINLNQYLLAILVLAFNSGAYLTEIFRAGIQSIPKGQFEASRSLGMTQMQTMLNVIVPQMVRRVIPTCTSEFILLYKDTSLLAAVGVMELMLYAKSFVATSGNMTPYVVAACFYLLVTLPLIKIVGIFENKLALADGNAVVKDTDDKKEA